MHTTRVLLLWLFACTQAWQHAVVRQLQASSAAARRQRPIILQDDYYDRAAQFEMVSREDAAQLSRDERVIWVDLRTPGELAQAPFPNVDPDLVLPGSLSRHTTPWGSSFSYINLPCTGEDYSTVQAAKSLIPGDATIATF